MSWQTDMGLPPDWQPPGFGGDGTVADPTKGTMVRMPDGTYRQFAATKDSNGNYISPKIFIGDEYDGGYAAAMPGTEEFSHYQNLGKRSNIKGAAEVAALVGGGALASAFLPGASGVTSGMETFEGAPGLSSVLGEQAWAPAVADMGGAGVLAPTAGAAAGTGAGGGLDAILGAASGSGGLAPGAGVLASDASVDALGAASAGGGGGGIWSSLGNAAKGLVTNGDGSYNWGNIIKLGGMGLSGLQALFNHPKQAQQPGMPAWMTQPLQVPNFSRTQNPMSTQDYYTYGQTGGEHQFFTGDRMSPLGQASAPQQQPVMDQGPMKRITDPTQRPMVAGGHVAGPGTGRSDDIDAKLSNGEYVMDAETVSLLGDGSTEAGAKRLDQLRSNLRKHKGSNLARGKFSQDAKDPLDYIPTLKKLKKAKGGNIGVIKGGMPKMTAEEAAAKLAMMKRLADAYREAQQRPPLSLDPERPPKDLGADPYNRDPLKKAEGGKVHAIDSLDDLADKLSKAIDLDDVDSQSIITHQLEALQPGFRAAMAKGGNVAEVIRRLRLGPPIGGAKNFSSKDALKGELAKITPTSPLLRDSTRGAPAPGGVRTQQSGALEGDDLLKQLFGEQP